MNNPNEFEFLLLQEGAAPVVISSEEDRSRSRDRFVAVLKQYHSNTPEVWKNEKG